MSSTPIERLRDKLLRKGRPSIAPGPWPPVHEQPAANAMYRRLRPIAEAMYLVMAADTQIVQAERDALRGALRILTEGNLSSSAMEAMLSEFRASLARDGLEQRLDDVASELYGDADDIELALALVAAAAMADGAIGDQERSTVQALAERLDVPAQRLRELMDACAPAS
jgi:uncharacterized membrane protein YebE (DUF533 family)